MANKIQKVVGVLIAILAIGATFSSSAIAEGTVTVSETQYSQSNFSASVSDKSVASVKGAATLNGKLEVKFIMPHGLPQKDRHECKWGDFAWSNWETSNGGIVWAPAGHHGWTHACLVDGVWRQIGGGPGQWNCGNVVKPMGALPPKAVKVKWSEIVVVKHFTYEVNLKVSATVSLTGSATASCALNGVSASSSITATGTATATASVKARGKSKAKAIAKAEGEAAQIVSRDETKASLTASAKANANVQINAQANANCSSVTPPPVCTPPNPECTPPPVVTNLETINDMEYNQHRTICADFYPPAGVDLHDLTILFKADIGSFAGNLQYKGGSKVCDTYTAPSEGSQEVYSAYVRDNQTGLSDEEIKTFPLHGETPF